jgi:cyclohexa-1,5-dienecarbonyl-CoA hydratase
MTPTAFIKVTEAPHAAFLTLARPPLNVLNIEMIGQMSAALEPLAQRRDLCALVIAAEGAHFCAGVDVGEHRAETVRSMLESFHGFIRLLHRFPAPVVAAVQGNALGGGMELACLCDITVAASNLRLGLPEITLAVFPPVAMAHLHRRVGVATAAELIFTGRTLDAQEALRLGLVSRVCEEAELPQVTQEIVRRLARHSAHALRHTRRAFRAAALPDFESALAGVERCYLEDLMKGRDPSEGLAAFLEKRKPDWLHE